MEEEKQIYEIRLYRPEISADSYSELHWRGWVRMSRQEREDISVRCTRAVRGGGLTTYSITPISPVEVSDLRLAIPARLRDTLGYGGPRPIRKTP